MVQVKSRERVRTLAEVYTAEREVVAMLDLVGEPSWNVDFRYLEPSCGNGNFLAKILERKLETVCAKHRKQADFEFYTLKSAASIYGVDICSENVEEAKMRLYAIIVDRYSEILNTKKATPGFYRSLEYILSRNIIHGDMLNGVGQIIFTEFSSPKIYKFQQRVFRLTDMMSDGDLLSRKRSPKPITEIPMRNYWELTDV